MRLLFIFTYLLCTRLDTQELEAPCRKHGDGRVKGQARRQEHHLDQALARRTANLAARVTTRPVMSQKVRDQTTAVRLELARGAARRTARRRTGVVEECAHVGANRGERTRTRACVLYTISLVPHLLKRIHIRATSAAHTHKTRGRARLRSGADSCSCRRATRGAWTTRRLGPPARFSYQ